MTRRQGTADTSRVSCTVIILLWGAVFGVLCVLVLAYAGIWLGNHLAAALLAVVVGFSCLFVLGGLVAEARIRRSKQEV